MGGLGSTRWDSHCKATTVEECRSIDAGRWVREGIIKPGAWVSGSWAWFRDAARTEQTSSIGYEVNAQADPPWLRLHYRFTDTQDTLDYRVRLTTTRPPWRGVRWWFICPLAKNDVACGRRVGKLYLPPAGRYFGCRHCHDLTYTSCQQHDKRVDALRRNPDALAAVVNDPRSASVTDLILALKALR
jgi:hypothetical protein